MSRRPRHLTAFAAVAAIVALVSGAPAAFAGAQPARQGGPVPAARTEIETPASLTAAVNKALRGTTAGTVDYQITVDGIGTLGRFPDRLTAPASNEKLFTTITLLQLLGPQFRYQTTAYGTAPIGAEGVLHGSLVLKGSGDPTLTKANLRSLARNLYAAGLRYVTGRLIVDDSRYSHTTLATGWKRSFIPTETGTVDAFSVNGNQWRRGAAFNRDPTLANAWLWRQALRAAHISVAGPTTVGRSRGPLTALATHSSTTLAQVVRATLTYSINFYAEMMLREAGARRTGHGSLRSGLAAVRALAQRHRLPLETMYDGSGLSYRDRESPATLVAWLTALRSMPSYGPVFFSLPLSCHVGTLQHRLCGPRVRGKVRAKTGTLDHISTLSGYTETTSRKFVTFSFLLSGIRKVPVAMSHVDAAISALVRSP
jgi:D-alanyl-D-alanine carboxypeptidase/D-alanyl-D-alanine-endopeptidase (penicillin-binding protein 4)